MVTKKPSTKNTKAEILEAFDELAHEKAALKSQVEQLAKSKQFQVKETQTIQSHNMNQSQSVQQKMNYTIEDLVKIQLGFGSAVSELSQELTSKASHLEEIQSAVATEIKELQAHCPLPSKGKSRFVC
jgi:hypothetical protein